MNLIPNGKALLKSIRKIYIAAMAKPQVFRRLMSIWPPYLFAGIRVDDVNQDFTSVTVSLNQQLLNRGHFGVHFGGSIYAMVDPFYVFMVMHQLGDRYYVWDKACSVEYVKPGLGKVSAIMSITQDHVTQIKKKAKSGKKVEPEFDVVLHDEKNEVVARVHKTLYVRLKPQFR